MSLAPLLKPHNREYMGCELRSKAIMQQPQKIMRHWGSSSVSVVEKLKEVLKFYTEGSVVPGDEPSFNLSPLSKSYEKVLHKDIVFEDTLGLWARVYLPPHPLQSSSSTTTRLPVILYFHGGGFCAFAPQSSDFHRFCVKWAFDVGALIVSVNYRLAPEHRLPVAYQDSISALQWLHRQSTSSSRGEKAHPWFDSHADFSKVFLMGDSAGGNIAHRVGLWFVGQNFGGDIRISGLILLYPYFGGEARTVSETKDSTVLTLEVSDAMWKMALPLGSDRDHYFCNPRAPQTEAADVWSLAVPLPPTFVVIGGRDILRDRGLDFCEHMKELCGNQIVEVMEFEEEDHDFTLFEMDKQNSIKVIDRASHFIKSAV